MKRFTLLFLAVFTLAWFQTATSGEVIGNTYISEKFGYVELNAPDGQWEITDTENEGKGSKLAVFKYKTQINGKTVSVSLWGTPNPNNVLEDDFFLKVLRDSYEEQGMVVNPLENKRFNGQKVYIITGSLEKNGINIHLASFGFAGKGGFFWLQLSALDDIYEQSKKVTEKLLETVKVGN